MRKRIDKLIQVLVRVQGDKSGSVLIIFAIALPLFIGALGLSVECANWYQTKHALQNAADEAAIAAATNGSSNFAAEAKAVTSNYGYRDGVGNVTVLASNTASCPAGGNNCYSVSVTTKVPLLFSQVVGYSGNTTIGTSAAQAITAIAVAYQDKAPREYCVLALANSGTGVSFVTNGAPKANLTGCNIMSNTSMTCNGHNLNATYGDAAGTNSGCGNTQTSNVSMITDPYLYLASSIPPNPCSSYAQKPAAKGVELPASNLLSGSQSWSSPQIICGDAQLSGDLTLSGSNNVLVIQNGQLDTNGYKISTASGAGATIIFSGDNSGSYTHAPTGGGTIDIAAPTSGVWSGVALYQDPQLTNGVNISAAGNSPTWNITGLTYLPHSSVTFSGAVNKSSSGVSCFVLVVDSLLINGTGSILDYGNCPSAGLTMPTNQLPVRGRLVS